MKKIIPLIAFTLFFPLSLIAETKMYKNPSGKELQPHTKVIKNVADAKKVGKEMPQDSDMRARPTYEMLNEDSSKPRTIRKKIYVAKGDDISSRIEKAEIR